VFVESSVFHHLGSGFAIHNGHGKYSALNNETRDARFPFSQEVEREKVSLREFHVNSPA
jgi:hypothetical protein